MEIEVTETEVTEEDIEETSIEEEIEDLEIKVIDLKGASIAKKKAIMPRIVLNVRLKLPSS